MAKDGGFRSGHTISRGLSLLLMLVLVTSTFPLMPRIEVKAGTPVEGIIFVDTDWTEVDSPIWVEGDIWLPRWVTLTVHPGVEVRFNGNYTIWVDGNLSSLGSPTKRISFVSNKTIPGLQDWFKIRVNATSKIEIRYTDFSNAFSAIELSGRSGDVLVSNSFSNSFIGIVASNSTAMEVSNSTFTNVYHSLKLTGDDNLIRNNSFIGGRIAVDISCNQTMPTCSNNIVEDNFFDGLEGGVYLRSDYYGTNISHNLVRRNSYRNVDAPIAITNLLGDSSNNTVANNEMENGAYGIFLLSSWNDIIRLNEITNFEEGVGLYNARNTTVARNTISLGIDGIVLRNHAQGIHLLFNNIVGFRSCGIALAEGTYDNLIHHNNLLDNRYNGCDAGDGNRWDNGYPSGGNFWSDYIGQDNFKGPNQDVPGSDKIGDTPHRTRGKGIDNYPLLTMPLGNVPVTKIEIELTGPALENVTISWNLTWPYGNASYNITRFEVYRSESYDQTKKGYQLLAVLSNRTFVYTDPMAGEGNDSNYFYFVCSVNLTNASSCSIDQVGKFTRSLSIGWNLISIPLIQKNWSTSKVLQSVAYDRVIGYETSNQGGNWKEYSPLKPSSELGELEITRGYWVHVIDESNLTVVGKIPMITRIKHSAGWNLIGYPSFRSYSVEYALDGKNWMRVEGFDNTTSPYLLNEMSGSDMIAAGYGYWIYFISSGVWTVRN